MANYPGAGIARDGHDRSLADTLYGILPSRALDQFSSDLRSSSIPPKRLQDAKSSPSSTRRGISASDDCSRTAAFLKRQTGNYWTAATGGQRGHFQSNHKSSQIELHQSICLNFSDLDNAESDLWILPDFDEWELDAPSTEHLSHKLNQGQWAPLVERAANSNRERLRRRLEGDGWDFVGGKYGEDGKVYEAESVSEESVDEEFDVVVLPVIEVS